MNTSDKLLIAAAVIGALWFFGSKKENGGTSVGTAVGTSLGYGVGTGISDVVIGGVQGYYEASIESLKNQVSSLLNIPSAIYHEFFG